MQNSPWMEYSGSTSCRGHKDHIGSFYQIRDQLFLVLVLELDCLTSVFLILQDGLNGIFAHVRTASTNHWYIKVKGIWLADANLAY